MIDILSDIDSGKTIFINSVLIFIMVLAASMLGLNPWIQKIRKKEAEYDDILNRVLLLRMPPVAVFILTIISAVLFGSIGFLVFRGGSRGLIMMVILGSLGFAIPSLLISYLKRKRHEKLESQLVGGIQSLASGVRAGLNLVQAMQMVARDAPVPLSQEISHLVREYEYGLSLDLAMDNAATRIGLPNYRLLFSALLTHRERGGDLGETLDDIARSIREIQRLEGRVQSLTAQGRTTAKWLACVPVFVLGFLLFFLEEDTMVLFEQPVGNIILGIVFVLDVISYFWIRKIMDIDL